MIVRYHSFFSLMCVWWWVMGAVSGDQMITTGVPSELSESSIRFTVVNDRCIHVKLPSISTVCPDCNSVDVVVSIISAGDSPGTHSVITSQAPGDAGETYTLHLTDLASMSASVVSFDKFDAHICTDWDRTEFWESPPSWSVTGHVMFSKFYNVTSLKTPSDTLMMNNNNNAFQVWDRLASIQDFSTQCGSVVHTEDPLSGIFLCGSDPLCTFAVVNATSFANCRHTGLSTLPTPFTFAMPSSTPGPLEWTMYVRGKHVTIINGVPHTVQGVNVEMSAPGLNEDAGVFFFVTMIAVFTFLVGTFIWVAVVQWKSFQVDRQILTALTTVSQTRDPRGEGA